MDRLGKNKLIIPIWSEHISSESCVGFAYLHLFGNPQLWIAFLDMGNQKVRIPLRYKLCKERQEVILLAITPCFVKFLPDIFVRCVKAPFKYSVVRTSIYFFTKCVKIVRKDFFYLKLLIRHVRY
jgi:hypothetical protein